MSSISNIIGVGDLHEFRILEIALGLGLDNNCTPSYIVYLARQWGWEYLRPTACLIGMHMQVHLSVTKFSLQSCYIWSNNYNGTKIDDKRTSGDKDTHGLIPRLYTPPTKMHDRNCHIITTSNNTACIYF